MQEKYEMELSNQNYPFIVSHCDKICNDESIQSSTVSTEPSTTASSYRSTNKMDLNLQWDANDIVVLHDSFSRSDCSRLTSDHESFIQTEQDSLNGVELEQLRYHNIDYDSPYCMPNATLPDDSFFNPCEIDVWWADDSTSIDEDLFMEKDGIAKVSTPARGRSLSNDVPPTRRRSLDIIRSTSSDKSKQINTIRSSYVNSNSSDHHVDRNKSVGSHRQLPSSTLVTNIPQTRRGSHRLRKTSFDVSELEQRNGKSTKGKQRNMPLRRSTSSPLERNQVEIFTSRCSRPSVETELPKKVSYVKPNETFGCKRAIGKRLSRSRSASIGCDRRVSGREDETPRGAGRRCSKSREILIEQDCHRTTSANNGVAVQLSVHQERISRKCNIHPLTARLLAEKAITRCASWSNEEVSPSFNKIHDKKNRYSHSQFNNRRKRNELKSFSANPGEERCFTERHAKLEDKRDLHCRFETNQHFQGAPKRQLIIVGEKVDQNSNKIDIENRHSKEDSSRRPTIRKHFSFSESPTRRINQDRCGKNSNIFNTELTVNTILLESCSKKEEKCIRHKGEIIKSQPRDFRVVSERKELESHQKKSIDWEPMPRTPESNIAACSYFTPRTPTPNRECLDQKPIEPIADNSAFWNIEPGAFTSNIGAPNRMETKKFCNERFV
jgi:hypothetical protein